MKNDEQISIHIEELEQKIAPVSVTIHSNSGGVTGNGSITTGGGPASGDGSITTPGTTQSGSLPTP